MERKDIKSERKGRQYETLLVSRRNGIFWITLNRPKTKNAISFKMYQEIQHALQEATNDETCSVAVFTGTGEYYSSGNDLGNFKEPAPSDTLFRDFVATFIDFPKPLIALVNGPAVGAAVTTLGLFDAVYASDRATFHTPFTHLALSPEGCSSYLFPKFMGNVKANELLLFNKKITAHQACDRNLVSEVIPHHSFMRETEKRVQAIAKLPKGSLQDSKMMLRNVEKQKLHEVNQMEHETLVGRLMSDEIKNISLRFFNRKKSKL